MTSSEALPEDAAGISPLRAWLFLIWLSWQRQARAKEMVWLAIGLLALACTIVTLSSKGQWWGMHRWRMYGRGGPTYQEWLERNEATWRAIPYPSPATSIAMAVNAANSALLQQSDFLVFTRFFLFSLFFSFLVPIWSLAFATEAIGGERESHGMIWLLTRPLSRPAIYLAKFIAVLPWCLALNLGGFALLCALAGRPGPIAFHLFWPAVLWSSLTFCSLFFLFGAFFRRPAIVGLVYSFFLEVIIGNMPGTLKRASVGFYARCMMFDEAAERGVSPDNPVVYDPVSGSTALLVLILSSLFLLALGMFLFRRAEYDTGD
jgi:ABC-type transport system involved in multi-copper enzyme maturation permease subunit